MNAATRALLRAELPSLAREVDNAAAAVDLAQERLEEAKHRKLRAEVSRSELQAELDKAEA